MCVVAYREDGAERMMTTTGLIADPPDVMVDVATQHISIVRGHTKSVVVRKRRATIRQQESPHVEYHSRLKYFSNTSVLKRAMSFTLNASPSGNHSTISGSSSSTSVNSFCAKS